VPTFAIVTLGCKVNQYDSQAIREALLAAGWRECAPTDSADCYIVNTCCVTRESHRKSLQVARRLARRHPGAHVVVAGCCVDADREAAASLPGVILVVGNDEKPRLAELLGALVGQEPGAAPRQASVWPQISRFEGHSRAFVKIEDGCNDFCSYCIVPYVRGRVRSRPPEEVVAEVERLVDNGYREVVLTGIHLGAYGSESDGRWSLVGLLERLVATPGLARLRLSSLELREVSDQLIDLVAAEPVVCPHFHIPLQSGDDAILRAMNRHYTARDSLARIEAIRRRIPEPAITTDIICGFPGESDEQFRHTLEVACAAAFSRIHVFPYSDRPGTRAAALPGKLPPQVIARRKAQALALARQLALDYHRRFLGRVVEPLVETRRQKPTRRLCGYTERYVRTAFDGPDALMGRLARVRVEEATEHGLVARLAERD